MQQYPLLQTKLYIPPIRPELVSRPRLIERLNEGLDRKLTLISAPAGFGKTTLVSEWLTGRERPAAWLSLDEGDNDPIRFLTYLIAALQTIAANLGKGMLGVLQSPQPPSTESILTALLNDISTVPDNFTLVLDDYHLIDATPVDHALTFLIEHLPPQMHLIIATREDPNFPLARLRARGQLTELRAADLRFTPSEAAEFLNQVMSLNLSTEDIIALEARTEGWIAGLQLAAISIQGMKDTTSFITSFAGSHRFVMDYLIEEVLHQQSEHVQTFLLRTSILDRLCGPLCEAVCSTLAASGQAQYC
jgi:LuxR family maltose regulon positive regulatory protein